MKLIIYLSILGIIGRSKCGVIINQQQIVSGNINIFTDKDGLHCGTLICPNESRCIITQKNHPNDSLHLVTREKCFDGDDNLIKENELTETVDSNIGIINKRYEVNSNGMQINDPEIQENLRKSIEQIQLNLRNAFSTPFFSSGFLGNNWPFGNTNNPFGQAFPFNNDDNEKKLSNGSGDVSNSGIIDNAGENSENKSNTRDREELENHNYNDEVNDVNL